MEWSIFLGKFFGIYLIIMSIFILIRQHLLNEVVDSFLKNSGLMYFSGSLLVFFGLLLVLSHNVWQFNWRVIITLLGYLMLLKGLMRLFFPVWGRNFILKTVHSNKRLYVGFGTLALGLYLTLAAYQAVA